MDKLKQIKIKTWIIYAVIVILIMFLLNLMTDNTCFFKATIGIPCAGCGMSRAVWALLHGHFSEATFFHPLVWALFPFLALLTVLKIKKVSNKTFEIVLFTGISVMCAVYVIRMILYFPDTVPMDYNPHSFTFRLIDMIKSLFK